MYFNKASATTTDPAAAVARRTATTHDVDGPGDRRPPAFTRGSALPPPMAQATGAYYLAGLDPVLLNPLLEDLAQRYLATREVTPVLYHAEDAQRLQQSLDEGLLRRLNKVFSYRNPGRLPAPDVNRLPGLIENPASSGFAAKADQAAWIVLNSLHGLPPAGSTGFAGYISRNMPGLRQVDVLLHGHPGNESGEVLMTDGNRHNRIITAPQIAATLGKLGIGEDHTVALQACHSADTDHPASPAPSAVGDATAHTFGAALRRAFNEQPDNPRLVTARHGWGLYGPADRKSPGASLPRTEERSMAGPSWAHEQRYAPWMKTGEDAHADAQLQVISAASFQAVYPSGPGALPHARAWPEPPVLRAPLARHVATQTDQREPSVDSLATHGMASAMASASAMAGPAVGIAPPPGTARETQTDAGMWPDRPAGTDRQTQTQTGTATPAPEFVYPAPWPPAAPPVAPPVTFPGAGAAVADAGVQTFATRDVGTQAGPQSSVPGTGVGGPPAVASVQTQTTSTTALPAITQTTLTYFDPALRMPVALHPFDGPREAGVQANLDGTHPVVH